MKEANELTRELKRIKKENRRAPFQRWCKSKQAVDQHYNKTELSAEQLYRRSAQLKQDMETYKLVTIPVIITLIFGIYVSVSLGIISYMKTEQIDSFLTVTDKMLEDGVSILPQDSIASAIEQHQQIVSETLTKIRGCVLLMIIVLVATSITLYFLIRVLNKMKLSEFEIIEYEMERIEREQKALEEHKRAGWYGSRIKLENGGYTYTFVLNEVTKN